MQKVFIISIDGVGTAFFRKRYRIHFIVNAQYTQSFQIIGGVNAQIVFEETCE